MGEALEREVAIVTGRAVELGVQSPWLSRRKELLLASSLAQRMRSQRPLRLSRKLAVARSRCQSM